MKIQYVLICLLIGWMIGGLLGFRYYYAPAYADAARAHTTLVAQEKSITYWTNYGTNLWAQYCTMTNDYTYTKMRLAGFTSTYDARIKEHTDKIAHLNDLLALKPTLVEKVVTQVVVVAAVAPTTDVLPRVVNTLPINGEQTGPCNEIRITLNIHCSIGGFSPLHGFAADELARGGIQAHYEGDTLVIPYKMKRAAFYSVKIYFVQGSVKGKQQRFEYDYSVDCI